MGNQQRPHGGWRWSPSSSSWKGSRIAKRPTPHAVRTRIDWKYALRLEVTDPGFDDSVLSEFRTRLLAGQAEQRVLTTLLEAAQAHGWVRAKGRQRTDSTHVLAAVRTLNRLEMVGRWGETLRHALNVLAEVTPEWLRRGVPAEWYDRYTRRIEAYRLPQTKPAREAYAQEVGADGAALLQQVEQAHDLPWLQDLPAIQILRAGWQQHSEYEPEPGAGQGSRVRWRTTAPLAAPGDRWESPSDPEARFATKRVMQWRGYNVHVTATCDPERPRSAHLITDGQTTTAPLPDVTMTQATPAGAVRARCAACATLCRCGLPRRRLDPHQSATPRGGGSRAGARQQ